VEVTRVESGTQDREPRVRAGTAFTGIDERSEQALRQFLRMDARSL
jgi:hypothetical protein